MNFLIFQYWPLIQFLLKTKEKYGKKKKKRRKTISADWIHPLGHQFATSPSDESKEMPEKLTKMWRVGKATTGKFALCYASSLADSTKTAVKLINCNS